MNGFKQDYQRLLQLFCGSSCGSELKDQLAYREEQLSCHSSTSQPVSSSYKVYNFTFAQFIQCFQQLKFSSILCGHRTTNSLREFYDQINEFLMEKLSKNQPIEIRIFSFYFMYALWFIQKKSYKLPLKIRVDSDSYNTLKDLVHFMSKQQQFDIVLAYRKLFLNGAFAFCESVKVYGPYYKTYFEKIKPFRNEVFVLKLNQLTNLTCDFSIRHYQLI